MRSKKKPYIGVQVTRRNERGGQWEVRWRDAEKRQRRKSFPTKEAADAHAAKLKRERNGKGSVGASAAWERPIAKEHKDLPLWKLVDVTIEYVRYVNAMAAKDDESRAFASTLSDWPGIIGKTPEYDDTSIRTFAENTLRAPRIDRPSPINKTAIWAVPLAEKIVKMLNEEGDFEKNDPCRIMWALDAYIFYHDDGRKWPYLARPLSCPGPRPLSIWDLELKDTGQPLIIAPSVNVWGRKIFVGRSFLHRVASVITYLYGPKKERVKVYADYLADFVLEFARDWRIEGIEPQTLFAEIKKTIGDMELTKTKELRIPCVKNQKLRDAVRFAWSYAPLNLKNIPVRKKSTDKVKNEFKGKDFYDFSLPGLKKTCRWSEDVQRPLIRAVLDRVPKIYERPICDTLYVATSEMKQHDLVAH